MAGDAPLRVTSLNPVRDAEGLGHVVGPSRLVTAAKGDALRHRFVRLVADGESAAIAAVDREGRTGALLTQLAWAQKGIVDDLGALETAKDASGRSAELLRGALDEIAVIVELSTGQPFTPAAWRQALDAFHEHVQTLIGRDMPDAVELADIDLALERLEHIEQTAAAALHGYLRFVSPES
jgi:hypothetical protein